MYADTDDNIDINSTFREKTLLCLIEFLVGILKSFLYCLLIYLKGFIPVP